MIQYIEKGAGMHQAIIAAGHQLYQLDGQWVSSDDTAVQAIIDAYRVPTETEEQVREAKIQEALLAVGLTDTQVNQLLQVARVLA